MLNSRWMMCAALLMFAGSPLAVKAGEPSDKAPWDYQAPSMCGCDCEAKQVIPPMFGDQFQFGFNFAGGGGFNFQGGFQFNGGFQFQGGFNFQGGFQFNGGFNFQGGFQGGGFNFQGGFNGGAPVAVARGAFKIAENGLARPEDRVYSTYNYYNNVLTVMDVHREMIGFEKTFFGGEASVEVRLPFIQNNVQNGGPSESDICDVTAIFKYALVNYNDTVISLGLAVTAPTGPVPTVIIQTENNLFGVHPWLLQPFIGYYQSFGKLYLQGFTSVSVPTESRDGSFLYNDVGVGYRLWEGCGLLRAIIPTFETHVNTPLQYRGAPGFADSVDLTAGSYFLLGERMTVGTAIGTPVTGPRLFSFEAIFSLNWRF